MQPTTMDIACGLLPAVSLNSIAIRGIIVYRMRENFHPHAYLSSNDADASIASHISESACDKNFQWSR